MTFEEIMNDEKPAFRVPKDAAAEAKKVTSDKLKDGLDQLKQHTDAKNANAAQR